MILKIIILSVFSNFVSGNEIFKNLKRNECSSEINKLIELRKFDEMKNFWSNFSKDYAYGNSFDFGNFDACLSHDLESIQPQHCLIQYQYKPSSNHIVIPVLPKISGINFNWKNNDERFGGAICVPDSCTSDDVRDLMREVLETTDFIQTDDYDQSKYCQTKNGKFKFDTLRTVSMFCILLIILIVLIGSLLTNSKPSSFTIKFLQCFSVKRNFATLIDFSVTDSTITCLNGIKAISLMGIFLFHSLLIKISFPFTDGKILHDLVSNDNKPTFVINSFLILIDTFMIVSGILIGRSLIKDKKLSFWKFCIQRYMRLTLLSLVLVCYNALNYSLFKFIPRPYVHIDFSVIDDCRDYWWTTALNIQTYVNPKHMCIPQAWYASVLFQLIVLAVLIHLIMKNFSNAKIFLYYGFIMTFGLILWLIVYVPRETYFETEPARALDMSNDIIETTYFTPFIRVFPFFSGIFLAHVFDKTENFNAFSNKNINKIIIYTAFYLSIIYIVLFPFIRPMEKYLAMSSFIIWTISTNIVIYACHKGYGGCIDDILSMKLWMPLSKMSLSIYLVALSHQGTLTVTRLTPLASLSTSDILIGAVMDAAIAALPTLLIYTTVECSITNVANLITGKEANTKEKS